MDDTIEHEKSVTDNSNKNDEAQYVDCIRLVEGGHIRRFENIVAKFDIIQYELNDGPSKPLIFYAIEHNDEPFLKVLLEMEIPLNKSYSNIHDNGILF
ncbi:unnamed protein product [Rotaria sordida]|uniref:Uncharacterized protein n=1 Tax=Rotaria sordida TaxID=392033 RepID=A0A813TY36_9BILA|nr:unnamed protein product [Rotaria sordida]CAF0922883.1 unnamed protein product [Rotaria sordida]CAF0932721.1 unnamed protein product [Rotaria sordida]CAF0939572.1 unnamed protein product [Rotaria sordida]CAF1035571.1 unnamed protein product [Rotaria sordida]